jgi:PST family polysaccharide transporter
MSVSFIFTSLSVVPASILNRNLEFKRLALVDLATAAARVVTILTMAILGWGVWSLVGCTLVGVVTNAGMLFLVSTWRPRIEFSLTETRQVMGFGANVTGFSIVNFMARNADNLLIGRFLGATQLGYYSLAYRVLLLPRDTVTVVLMQVLFPKLSKSQDNDAELKNIYLRACGGIALVTFPMMLGVMVVAEPLVHLVLGPPWLPAVPLIQVLAPLGMLQSILATIGSLTLAKGRSDVHLRVGVAFSSIVILSFAIGLPFGVIGVACAYSIACLISCIPMFAVTYSLVADLRVSHLAETIFPAFCCALAMAIAVVIFRTLASQVFGAPVVLCSSVLTGIITYVSLVRFFQPPAYTDIAKLLPARFSKALGIS